MAERDALADVGRRADFFPTGQPLMVAADGSRAGTRALDTAGGWTLTVTGGDASTAFRTVMEFTGSDVRGLKEYAREGDDAHPYVTETFAVPTVLN